MTPESVRAYLLSPNAVVAFDTNAIIGNKPDQARGIKLIDHINLINSLAGTKIRKVFPAIVYHEKLRQMRIQMGARFDAGLPESFLLEKKIDVEPFEKSHAERTAERLERLYPKQGDWRAHKKRRCLECVGLPRTLSVEGDGSKCGATVDWLIASQADLSGYLLISDDKRDEFREVALLATLEVASKATQRLLDEVTAAG